MEIKIVEDIGEEIISRLKELIAILEIKAKEIQNGKEFAYSHPPRD